MHVLIVGSGSISTKHVANIRKYNPEYQLTLLRKSGRSSASRSPRSESNVDRVVESLEEALAANPQAALICSPTSEHVSDALSLGQRGIHIFVEKPLSNSLVGLPELEALVRDQRLVFRVGYNFRYCEAHTYLRNLIERGVIGTIVSVRIEVGQYLPYWRDYDYRHTTSAQKNFGGGVILELSHEIEYFNRLFGPAVSVFGESSRRSDLEIDVEDCANILIETSQGVSGLIHLNMVQKVKSRSCTVIGTEGHLSWDGVLQQVSGIAKDGIQLNRHPDNYDENAMYFAELVEFFESIEKGRDSSTEFMREKRILELILAIKQSADEHKVIEL